MTSPAQTSATQLVATARTQIEELSVEQLTDALGRDQIVLIDVREQAERDAHGAIPGAVHIPRGLLEFCADPTLPVHAKELDPRRHLVIYCAVGNRSALAAMTLRTMGFPHVWHLQGGFEAWQEAGGATAPASGAETACWARLL